MSGDEKQTAQLKVRRGGPEDPARYQTFAFDFEAGQSVLDALRWIRGHQDASLAVRFACINANACKECLMRIDGKTAYACTTHLRAEEMLIEPLANKRLIRDLVCDTVPPNEHWLPMEEEKDG